MNIKNLFVVAFALALAFTTSSAIAQVPGAAPLTMTYQGALSDVGGQAVNGTRTIAFRLYAERQGGEALWNEVHPDLDVSDGSFSVVLGEVSPLPADLDPAASLWLGVQVDDDAELQPRMRVGGALRAQWAAVAAQALDVAGRHIHPSAVSIGERPVIDGHGRWIGDPTGLQGPPGEAGLAGSAGLAGDPGRPGTDGLPGVAGRQGDPGPRGSQGEAGPAGSQGLEGFPGAQGPGGPQGASGSRGDKGDPGDGLDLTLDSDMDGYLDWLEAAVGSDPSDPVDMPFDAEGDGVPDLLQPSGGPGAAGIPGPPGPPGPAGSSGQQGDPGSIGPAGPQGVAGPPGAQGNPGPGGPQGQQGNPGPGGVAGAQGPAPSHNWIGTALQFSNPDGTWANAVELRGAQGPRGDVGPQGAIGPQGIQGLVGAAGVRGDIGPQGGAGAQGLQGLQGAVGAVGPIGPQGLQGNAGPVGPMGPGVDLHADTDRDGFADWLEVAVGTDKVNPLDQPVDLDGNGIADALQGVPGVAGPQGPVGAQGPQGVPGPQGLIGPVGPVGHGLDIGADSDGDGFTDWIEVSLGTDLLDPLSRPDDRDGNGVADLFEGRRPGCGDDIQDPGEACDLGIDNGDFAGAACRTNCLPARCGDGIVDAGETCDTGAANSQQPGSPCRLDCTARRCGDGVVDGGETCDDGNRSDNDPCLNSCTRRMGCFYGLYLDPYSGGLFPPITAPAQALLRRAVEHDNSRPGSIGVIEDGTREVAAVADALSASGLDPARIVRIASAAAFEGASANLSAIVFPPLRDPSSVPPGPNAAQWALPLRSFLTGGGRVVQCGFANFEPFWETLGFLGSGRAPLGQPIGTPMDRIADPFWVGLPLDAQPYQGIGPWSMGQSLYRTSAGVAPTNLIVTYVQRICI